VSAQSEGPISTEGGINAAWILQRASKGLRDAGIAVFESFDEARKAGTYAPLLGFNVDSMHIEGSSYYPWTIEVSLYDSADFADGTRDLVTIWQHLQHGFGGSNVVVDQVSRVLGEEISGFAIAVLKQRQR
jgi:hypothetical protein